MKKLLFLTYTSLVLAQGADCDWSGRWSNRPIDQADGVTTFKTNGATAVPAPARLNLTSACTAWIMVTDVEGFSAVSVELDVAPMASPNAAGTFSSSTGLTTVSGSNPSTSTTISTYLATGYNPWYRANVTTVTGTGSINVHIIGWRSQAYLASGGSSTVTPGISANYASVQASGLQKFRLALAKTRAAVSNTRILGVGASEMAGNGSGCATIVECGYLQRTTFGYNTANIPMQYSWAMGANFDARFTSTTGWSTGQFGMATGSSYYATSAPGSNLVLTLDANTGSVDTYDVYYGVNPGFGSFSVQATGGSSSGTISTAGAANVTKTTITGTAGTTNTVTVTWVSGTVVIIGIDFHLSTKKSVVISDGGVISAAAFGATTGAWTGDNQGMGGIESIKAYAPDLCIIMLSTNDIIAGNSVTNFTTAMQTVITACQVSGDAMLLFTVPQSGFTGPQALQVPIFQAALYTLASTNNIPIIDFYKRFNGTYQSAMMADSFHPNLYGHWDLGAALTSYFISIAGLN